MKLSSFPGPLASMSCVSLLVLAFLIAPRAAAAMSYSCSMLPRMADWIFGAAYVGIFAWFVLAMALCAAGWLRRRALLYPIWAFILVLPLNFVTDIAIFAHSDRDRIHSCHP